MRPLRVISVLYYYEPDLETPGALLERYATIHPQAIALQDEGAQTATFMRFRREAVLEDRGARFAFCKDCWTPQLRRWQVPWSFHEAVRDFCAKDVRSFDTVVHVHGLLYPLQLRALRASLPPDCALVAQHHADRPWGRSAHPLQKWGLRSADGFFFAARDLGKNWRELGLITPRQQVFQVMEGSNGFHWSPRAPTRERTGMVGDPILLWVGRLIPLKDPLTVLAGFEQVLQQIPRARLYMIYGEGNLLPAVRARLTANPQLANAVTLLGQVPHGQLEDIYNSADYFVLGSHSEGSSFALAEALACGVIPVITDIPSFRAMTNDGEVGVCWRVGSAAAFAEAFLRIAHQPIEQLANEARHFFRSQLSYPAIARHSIRAYRDLLAGRGSRA